MKLKSKVILTIILSICLLAVICILANIYSNYYNGNIDRIKI